MDCLPKTKKGIFPYLLIISITEQLVLYNWYFLYGQGLDSLLVGGLTP